MKIKWNKDWNIHIWQVIAVVVGILFLIELYMASPKDRTQDIVVSGEVNAGEEYIALTVDTNLNIKNSNHTIVAKGLNCKCVDGNPQLEFR